MRGRKHKVINCSAVRSHSAGVSIFCEPEGGESWGHEVVDFLADGVLTRSLEVSLNPTGHPSAGVNETRTSYISGISIRNAAGEGVNLNNGDVRIERLDYVSGAELTGTRLFVARNYKVEGTRWRQDLGQVTTGTGVALLKLESGASADLGEWDNVTGSANASKITYAISGDANTIVANVRRLTMSQPPGTFIYTALGTGSKVD